MPKKGTRTYRGKSLPTGIPGEMFAGNWKGGDVTADITPPAVPTAFVATGSDSGASLVWTNPADVDFHRTRVLRSTAGYASSPQPGGSQKLVDEVGGRASTLTVSKTAARTTSPHSLLTRRETSVLPRQRPLPRSSRLGRRSRGLRMVTRTLV